MQEIDVGAKAKVNLTLDVLHRRPDGYHEVEMIMQTIDLQDEIRIKRRMSRGITVNTDNTEVPDGPENLAYRAVDILRERCGFEDGLEVSIAKKIPVGAGLAGGSADAAAVLTGVNQLLELGLTQGELMELGATLGSDVPFCLTGGAAIARGRGELLEPLAGVPEFWLVLVKPRFSVSTATVYSLFNPELVRSRPDNPAMKSALIRHDLRQVAPLLVNVLETVTVAIHPEVDWIKQQLLAAGAVGALMSGSGPTVFALVQSEAQGLEIAGPLANLYDEVFVTRLSTGGSK